jgi:hypothetical protein
VERSHFLALKPPIHAILGFGIVPAVLPKTIMIGYKQTPQANRRFNSPPHRFNLPNKLQMGIQFD